jgi:hypothetical protein
MRIHRMISTMGFSLLLAIGLLPLAVHAADQKSAVVAVPTQSAVAASGAVEDTLPICLKRIPEDATPGQRLIAEQSCQRDESGRASMQAVPGR